MANLQGGVKGERGDQRIHPDGPPPAYEDIVRQSSRDRQSPGVRRNDIPSPSQSPGMSDDGIGALGRWLVLNFGNEYVRFH